MSLPRPKPNRVPIWQLALLGVVRAFQGLVTHPLKRMWRSQDAIDAYALNHLTSIAGDALLAVSLADSVFFSLPVDESRVRVALYLGITMLPLAIAGPFIVPFLDRAGPRRSVTFAAAAARCVLAILLAPRMEELALFPLALLMLACAKAHSVAKNGLTMAYADRQEGLLRANARLGRIAVAGAITAVPIGWVALKLAGISSPIYVAAIVYAVSAALALRLPQPRADAAPPPSEPMRGGWSRGRLPHLAAPALGAIGLRAAGGFLLFLLAFSLRTAEVPAYWFAVAGAAGIGGGFLADLLAPTLPSRLREEALVIACLGSAAVGALLAWTVSGLPLLAVYALTAGIATEFARLALQSLIQRDAPAGALGSVVVRYEALYQVSWVAAAFVPTLIPIAFRTGIVMLAMFYLTLVAIYWWRWRGRLLDAPAPQRPLV